MPNKDQEVLVKVEGLSKKFCKDLKTSLWYGVQDLLSNLKGNRAERELREKEFWAVKDISFELRRGECLGLIGHNGAGKSTLLKILNGLLNPDAGKVTIKGRVGALIELGAGFNPILTGRENIYNNGAILGFSRKEINEKLDEIIDFAEIREFIDMPVQNYSSGMKVRLGFAVAAQMEPDVLIIDEVLAVGDMGFKLKCFKTIDEILPRTAIVFVSHSMPQVSRLCNQVILMEQGKSSFQGNDIARAIDLYYNRFLNNSSQEIFSDGTFRLEKVELMGATGYEGKVPVLHWNDNLNLFFKFKVKNVKEVPRFVISIFDKEQRPIAVFEKNDKNAGLEIKDGNLEFFVNHPNLQLTKGLYSLHVLLLKMNSSGPILRMNDVLSFQIIHKEDVWPPLLLKTNYQNYSIKNLTQ
ncbi:ABC transporter [Salegentibacter salinarum]|uniref:ABC transporter n=1 Tax=Salegentibacter salinarum TaxID=447422 RepID=A0A2N0U298_9FLAO|nr:ABC transporter ATP-binding protein [Salegentibacter salinarum]PKD21133.1 ABC transporter [Salegentibacter salinarum]SKB76309.1 lipopolysaccharide transport system ATP-binding protein [Salegentibacter salinarum]